MLSCIETDVALKMLYDIPVEHRTETVGLGKALFRVSASTVVAQMAIPLFDKSPYDGYAFRGVDTAGASRENPVILKIVEELPAGTSPKKEITSGTAAKILTGAPIPNGADSTIKYELTGYTDSEVSIFEPVSPDTDIVYAGSDVKSGDVLAQQGAYITAPIISSLANQGFTDVHVYKKPVITVISTGDELCEVGEPLRPAAIYNSNTYTICAYLAEVGASPINGGSLPDNPKLIAEAVGSALESSDMVITSGGASVGDYDWAVRSAEILGGEVLFWEINMKPGGALMAAVKDSKVILGLSGNPAAAVLGLHRVAMPYIKKLCGISDCFYPRIEVMLKEQYKKKSPKLRLLRGRLEVIDSKAYFVENRGQGSEVVSSLSGCDLLGEIPLGSPPLPAGTIIKAYRI